MLKVLKVVLKIPAEERKDKGGKSIMLNMIDGKMFISLQFEIITASQSQSCEID